MAAKRDLRALAHIATMETFDRASNERLAAQGGHVDRWSQPGAWGRTQKLPWRTVQRLSEAVLIERVSDTGDGWDCKWRCTAAGQALLDSDAGRVALAEAAKA